MTLQGSLRPRDLEKRELPKGWESEMSRSKGKMYYRNLETGATQWKPPRKPSSDEGSQVGEGSSGGFHSPMTPPHRQNKNYNNTNNTQNTRLSRLGSDMSSGTSYVSVLSGHRMDCICEICECGRHHCNVHMPMQPYGAIESAYREAYPWHDLPEKYAKQGQQQYSRTEFDPNHFATTNSTAFVPHAVQGRHKRPQSAPAARKKFDAISTYQAVHGPKTNPDLFRNKTVHRYPPKIKFDHKTTAQCEYQGLPGERSASVKPASRLLQTTPFTGDSTYNSMFKTPEGLTRPEKPSGRGASNLPEDRDFLSTKQISYTKPPLANCPAASLPRKQASKHTGHTHYHKMLSMSAYGE
eukprot:gene16688-25612_t